MRDLARSVVVLSGSLLLGFGSYLNILSAGSGGFCIVVGAIAVGCGLWFVSQSRGDKS